MISYRKGLFTILALIFWAAGICRAMPETHKAKDGVLLPQIFRDMQELSVAYLRPGEIRERLDKMPIVYIPIGPLEWHGLHMPFGSDPLDAQTVALAACRVTGGVVWPPLYLGAANLRTPEQAEGIFGFEKGQYVWSLDFPGNIVPSAFCPAEILAVVVRETIREAAAMGAKLVVVISGHEASNHVTTLQRIATEITASGQTRVYYRSAVTREEPSPGTGGHACAWETSLMMAQTRSVSLGELPPLPKRLKYSETGIVDNFNGTGRPGYTVADETDPRLKASVELGEKATADAVRETVEDVLAEFGQLKK